MRNLAAIGLAAALTAIGPGNAEAAAAWEGFLNITGRTAQCAGVRGTHGTHVSVYRPALNGKGTSWLSIIYVRAAITLRNLSEATIPQMNGTGSYKGYVVGSQANFFAYNSTYDFTVTPGTVVGGTPIVTIAGTINNIFRKAGCAITFEAKYHRQP